MRRLIQQSQKLKGFLEACVLKIVSEKKCYSQEIVSVLKDFGLDSVTDGTIFPLLIRMEKEDLFDTERVKNENGPARKYYSLNENGYARLQQCKLEWIDFRAIMDNIMEEKNE